MTSSLVSRNVTVGQKRTSVRLEPEMWRALEDLCQREAISINAFCTEVARKGRRSSFTSALRAEIVTYFQQALWAAESRRRAPEHLR